MRLILGMLLIYSTMFGANLYVGSSFSESVAKGQWRYHTFTARSSGTIEFKITNLSDDVDLYVKKGASVSKTSWDCRPYRGGRGEEICTVGVNNADLIHIGVQGYRGGSYNLGVTMKAITSIAIEENKSNFVRSKEWRYYQLTNTQNLKNIRVELSGLSADVDLYVKKGSLPTRDSWDCRPYTGGTTSETCKVNTLSSAEKLYIGVNGYRAGSYQLKVTKPIKKHATILLHGLASSHLTWKALVDNKFNGKCNVIYSDGNIQGNTQPYAGNGYCFQVDFGRYDSVSGLKDLEGKECTDDTGCKGDYSTFSTLGKEVNNATTKILALLGSNTDITLVGHSRGGIAAAAYLSNPFASNRENVVAMLTTGTPFSGSPLGKIHRYLKEKALPYKRTGAYATDWIARDRLKMLGDMDVASPSVGFLEGHSSAFKSIFTKLKIKELHDGKRYYQNLIYRGVKLGDLFIEGNTGITYNPFPSIQSTVSAVIGNFSRSAESFMIGSNPAYSASLKHGDGIVPHENQDMKSIEHSSTLGQTRHITSFNSQNRETREYNRGVIHIHEPVQVQDLGAALDRIFLKRMSNQIPLLLPASEAMVL